MLEQFYIGAQVRLIDSENNAYEGEIIGMDSAEWSESGEDEIILGETSGSFGMFAVSKIRTIELLN